MIDDKKRSGSGAMKILLVEDDKLVRDFVELVLVEAGFQVTTASSSATALDLVSRVVSPEMIVMDFNLGGELDGVDVAEKLICRCPEASFILISGDADLAEAKLHDRMGGSRPLSHISFLSKPFIGADLLSAIDRTAHQKSDATL